MNLLPIAFSVFAGDPQSNNACGKMLLHPEPFGLSIDGVSPVLVFHLLPIAGRLAMAWSADPGKIA